MMCFCYDGSNVETEWISDDPLTMMIKGIGKVPRRVQESKKLAVHGFRYPLSSPSDDVLPKLVPKT
jgi:hypothetical protein